MRHAWAYLTTVLLVATALRPPASPADDGCKRYADASVRTGRTPRALPELSGLAASRRHRGIYWAHNDSGNALAVHAIRESGTVAATFTVRGVDATDPEDIAVGPCTRNDARSCIFIADTGNNLRARTVVQLVRVVEPAELRSGPLIAEVLTFRYPDGAHDAEGLLVDPKSGGLYVVTKALLSLGDAYRVAWGGKPGAPAEHVAALAVPDGWDALVTAASAHPSGTRVLLRTYRGVWELRDPGARSLADVLRARPRAVPAGTAIQGEAISYTADGKGFLLGAEGEGSALERVDCADRPGAARVSGGKARADDARP